MAALQKFIRDEIVRRQWTVPEFARRSGISPSLAYQIIDGRDNVRRSTFESIASALGMTPAELATAIGSGDEPLTPREVQMVVAFRSLPEAEQSMLERFVQGLRLQRPRTGANSHASPTANSKTQGGRKLGKGRPGKADDNGNPTLTSRSHRPEPRRGLVLALSPR